MTARDRREWDRLFAAAKKVQNGRRISQYVEAGGVAAAILSASGKVYTGVCVIRAERELKEYEVTEVRFREMTAREIEAYVDTKEPMDKAGAYGAQGKGALFVEGISGDFFNVMGLPVCRLGKMLNEQGVGIL